MEITEKAVKGTIAYLLNNKKLLYERLKPLITQRNELLKIEDVALHSDVEIEFEILARREIADEISTGLQLDPEEIFLVVETMDIKGFLKELNVT